MFPAGFFPTTFFPSNFWPKTGAMSHGHGGGFGAYRTLIAMVVMNEARMAEMQKRATESLINRLAEARNMHLAEIIHQQQIAAQTAYTALFAEI